MREPAQHVKPSVSLASMFTVVSSQLEHPKASPLIDHGIVLDCLSQAVSKSPSQATVPDRAIASPSGEALH